MVRDIDNVEHRIKASMKPLSLRKYFWPRDNFNPLRLATLLDVTRLMCNNLQRDLEWRLDPEEIDLLISPILRRWGQFKIVVPEQSRGNKAHLMVSKADAEVSHRLIVNTNATYFLPTQFLGPHENGCTTSFLSEPYSAWPSGIHRSGT